MKKNLFLLLVAFVATITSAQQNHHLSLLGQLQYPDNTSSLWGYEAPDGTPYAIVGTESKVSIVSLINPAAPVEVASVPGTNTQWREMKVWDHYAYVSLDNSYTGMQIIDLQYLPDSIKYINWTAAGIENTHTVSMDENGIMIANGTNLHNGASLLFDVKVNPWNPVFLGFAGNEYVHDSYARGDTLWTANINDGHFKVYDISNKANPILLATQETPNQFTHNIWPTDDNKYVFTTDEVGDSYVTAYDVTNLSDIKEVDRWRQSHTPNGNIVPHNVHVLKDFIITAHYTDGTIVLDGHRPNNLVEVARYNSYIQGGTGFSGVWGAYPYFKNHDWILATDQQNGLIIMQPSYQRACYLEGKITNQSNGQPVVGVTIEIFNGTGILSQKKSNIMGDYATGAANAGTYTLKISKPGFYPKEFSVSISNGQVTTLNTELVPIPTVTISGLVKDAANGDPIQSAKVVLKNADFSYEFNTDAAGNFTIPQFYEGDYSVFAGKWGYKTQGNNTQSVLVGNSPLSFNLEKGYEDPFALDLGWTITGTSVFSTWELAKPQFSGAPGPGFPDLQPGEDTPDLGESCYVTGATAAVPFGLVSGGQVVLHSPLMDMTNIVNPKISFASWYLAVRQDGSIPATKMKVKLKKGTLAKVVLERTFDINEPLDWKYFNINVVDFFAIPGENMQFIVEIGQNNNFDQFFEGLLDDFKVTEGEVASKEPLLAANILSVSPNPTNTNFSIRYNLEKTNFEEATITILNILGEKVAETTSEAPQGEWYVGSQWPAGVYFAQVRVGDQVSVATRLVKQ
jgi:choice-of-anchor B domain-containing protein